VAESINRDIIDIAKRIYLSTPYRPLRRLFFKLFCAVVRGRKVRACVDGITYQLDLGEAIDVGIYLNRYEPDVTAIIERICRPGFIVLDIGANVGAHALRFAKIVGDMGKVIAFEPMDYAFQKLLANIALNSFSNIIPLRIALCDRNLPGQEIQFRSSWPTKGKPKGKSSIVDFKRLDDWYKSERIDRVDLIKLDVDGNERSVLLGAESILGEQHPTILIEAWGPNLSDENRNPFLALKEIGYRFYDISNDEEYSGIDSMRELVSKNGRLTDCSVNILAKRR